MRKVIIFIKILLFFGFIAIPSVECQEKVDSLKQTIKEAEELFKKSMEIYEKGDIKKSEKIYRKALQKLSSIGPEECVSYQIKEEFDTLFCRLNKLFENTSNYQEIIISSNSDNTEEKKYTIPINKEDETVKKYINLYTQGKEKEKIISALERSGRYRDMILKVLKEYDLPEELVYLPVVESFYNIDAYSRAGALGLWQLMPKTARNLGLHVNYWLDERKDPVKSTYAAAKYLKELFLLFNDWKLALAAYNRGEYGLGRDLNFSKAVDFKQLSNREALPQETENFVPKFEAVTIIAENYKDYGLEINFEKPLEYDEVQIDKAIDLEIIAKCSNLKVSTIKEFNPAIMAWCTPSNYPGFVLRLPKGTKDMFLENIANVKDLNPSRGYIKYKVKKGDCLSKIADKFYTTVSIIKKDNRIKNSSLIYPNQVLIIRPGRKYFSKFN